MLERQLDEAVGNYLELSKVLLGDVSALLAEERPSQEWRRNFVRASVALIEGYAHCMRKMCAVALQCDHPPVSDDERGVVNSERGFAADDRIRLTLRSSYKLFSFGPLPDFSSVDWQKARALLAKRDRLTHPKNASDLEVLDDLWLDLKDAVGWLVQQLVGFMHHFHARGIMAG
jgi:hypothetical protein